MVGRPPSEARAVEMRRVLAELDHGRESTKSFCERRGISRSLIAYWRKRLATSGSASHALAQPQPSFVPVRVVTPAPTGQEACWIVELTCGTRILVPPGFDAEELRRLVHAVSAC